MKFAVVNGERCEPQPKAQGLCPGCGEPVTAKCGTQRVWHWAHKGRLTCDPWWEPETIWHRAWKNLFPLDWQEIPLRSSETGELHIADVRTPHGLVMEFQHSAIDPVERKSREAFYRDMIWVVDGARLKSDLPRINEHLPDWRSLPEGIIQRHWSPVILFPRRWLDSDVPVLFDYSGTSERTEGEAEEHLICLLPNRFEGQVLFFTVRRATLVQIGQGGAQIFDWRAIHTKLLEQKLRMLQNLSRTRLLRRSRF